MAPKNKKKKSKKSKNKGMSDEALLDALLESEIGSLSSTPAQTATSSSSSSSSATTSESKRKKTDPHWYKGVGNFIPDAEDPKNLPVRGIEFGFEPKLGQTFPPSIPVSKLYADAKEEWPVGEIMLYDAKTPLRPTAEARALDRARCIPDLKKMREAAEAHRQTRMYAQTLLRPGIDLNDFVYSLENKLRELIQPDGIRRGLAFPTGTSVNECAAHYTPNPGDSVILGKDDVISVDFGSHVDGFIIDCAFSVAFNPQFDGLLKAAKEATETGIREAGIGARLNEIGGAIQETMESFEIEIDGQILPIKPITNLNGHSVEAYHIHAGKSVPPVNSGPTTKMEEGEVFAIETFASTGKGYVHDSGSCSHYMKNFSTKPRPIRSAKAKALLKHIDNNYSTLAWCHRWLHRDGQSRYQLALRSLVDADIIRDYPPLCDVVGSYTAQYEHTICLRPTCKEVISRGQDF